MGACVHAVWDPSVRMGPEQSVKGREPWDGVDSTQRIVNAQKSFIMRKL